MKQRCLYLKVTQDKYEFPLFVSEGAKELAEHEGVKVNTIYSSISHYERGDTKTAPYRRVKLYDE